MKPLLSPTETRRDFVKKSFATSASLSFAGLIRAHGEEGGGTTWNPEETTFDTTCGESTTWIPEETTFDTTYNDTTTWNPEETTFDTTDGDTTTWNPEETTFETTDGDITTWNPEETTVDTETTVATTAYPYVEGEPKGKNPGSGWNEIWTPLYQGKQYHYVPRVAKGSEYEYYAKAETNITPVLGKGGCVTIDISLRGWKKDEPSKAMECVQLKGWLDDSEAFHSDCVYLPGSGNAGTPSDPCSLEIELDSYEDFIDGLLGTSQTWKHVIIARFTITESEIGADEHYLHCEVAVVETCEHWLNSGGDTMHEFDDDFTDEVSTQFTVSVRKVSP